MKKLFLIQLMSFIFLLVNAQVDSSRNLTLKFPVSSLAGDIFGESMGFGIGIEKMIKPGMSVGQEIGYIFHVDNTSVFSEDLESINGLKFTTELRKYLNKRERPESGFFANVELKNIITKSVQQSWSVEDMLIENEILRYRGSLLANLGVLFYWDPAKKSKITLELLAGGGLGYVNASSVPDAEFFRQKSDYNSKQGFYPWLNVDFKIGYVLQ